MQRKTWARTDSSFLEDDVHGCWRANVLPHLVEARLVEDTEVFAYGGKPLVYPRDGMPPPAFQRRLQESAQCHDDRGMIAGTHLGQHHALRGTCGDRRRGKYVIQPPADVARA